MALKNKKSKIKNQKYDRSNMRKIILDFPRQFRIGIEAAKGVTLKPGVLMRWPKNIIVCGMGGSGLAGDILVTLRSLDVFSYKSYGLPPQAGNESLIICLSYSGNTEETLSAFSEAVNRNLPLISITTGGKLEKLSKKYGIPLVKIPGPKIPPRLALGEMTASLIQVLVNHYILGPEISEEILKVGASLKSEFFENQGKKLAKKIFGKIPIIYTSGKFRELGWIWKNSLNETAKVLAICNYFPELNHNEIMSFEKIKKEQISNDKLLVLILRDLEDHPQILKRMKITKEIINREGVEVEFIDIEGKTMLEKIFSTALLGFWTAFWLALAYKIDPTPVKTIDEFKKRLKYG
jgi:glucose/mannose-6-phosphate isomerase